MLRWNVRNVLILGVLGGVLMFLAAATAGAASGTGKSVSPMHPTGTDGAAGSIRASVPLTTPTPFITWTPTPTTATPTCCTNMVVAILTPSCSYNAQTGQFSFTFYVEVTNQCGRPVPGTMTDSLWVSPDATNWTMQATSGPIAVTIPPGPPPYARFASFSNQTIAPQNQYYRVLTQLEQGGTCQVYTYLTAYRPLCWPGGTPVPTHTATVTPTGTPPSPTPTATCTVTTLGGTSNCTVLAAFNYSFYFSLPCAAPLTGNGTVYFEVGPSAVGPWTIHNQRPFTHTFTLGTSDVSGIFTEPNIPAQHTVYRVRLEGTVSNGQTLATSTNPLPICRPNITPSPTPTGCPVQYTDVPSTNPFYPFVRCLACRQIVSGYADGTFRPYADVTRGQLAKIISQAAGLAGSIPSTQQTFSDVPNSNPFWLHVERLYQLGAISGYTCGGPGEPCDPQNRPYFRWGAAATRGQISKIIAVTAGWNGPIPTTQQTFADVQPPNAFWTWIEELASRQIISGYACGGPGEPCDPQQRPYFRWGANATRGQMSKIAANSFFPNCITPARR